MVGIMLLILLANLGGGGGGGGRGDEAKVLEKIRSMEKEELQYMRELRAENSQEVERDEELKSMGVATSPVLYCFCRRPESGYILQCELCNEWYHASCLHLPKGKQGSVEKDSRFVCNLCVQPVCVHQAAEAGWPGVPPHILQEGPHGW